jgi:hypothetical protein
MKSLDPFAAVSNSTINELGEVFNQQDGNLVQTGFMPNN